MKGWGEGRISWSDIWNKCKKKFGTWCYPNAGFLKWMISYLLVHPCFFRFVITKMNSTDLGHFMAAVRDEFYKSQAYSQSSANGGW